MFVEELSSQSFVSAVAVAARERRHPLLTNYPINTFRTFRFRRKERKKLKERKWQQPLPKVVPPSRISLQNDSFGARQVRSLLTRMLHLISGLKIGE